MVARGDIRVRPTGAFLLFFIVFLFMGASARGEGLYARTDELICGNTKVQAFTTCPANASGYADCAEQHFVFTNQTTGFSARVQATSDPMVKRDTKGRETESLLWGLARSWMCVRGKTRFYVIVWYGSGGNCWDCEWEDVYDLEGRRVTSDKGTDTDEESARFVREWRSLGVPEPFSWDSRIPIQIYKKDRR